MRNHPLGDLLPKGLACKEVYKTCSVVEYLANYFDAITFLLHEDKQTNYFDAITMS